MARGADIRDVEKDFGRQRLAAARAFMGQARQTEESAANEYERAAALSSAILAAIAAADAVCTLRLGQVWKGEHTQVHTLLRQVKGADQAANALRRVVGQKTQVQYQAKSVSPAMLTSSLRQAQIVIDYAEEVAAHG